jgi:hypothetical protein
MTAWACGRTDSQMSAWASEMSSLMTAAGSPGLTSGLAACGTYAAMPEQLRAAFDDEEEDDEEFLKKHFEKFVEK